MSCGAEADRKYFFFPCLALIEFQNKFGEVIESYEINFKDEGDMFSIEGRIHSFIQDNIAYYAIPKRVFNKIPKCKK